MLIAASLLKREHPRYYLDSFIHERVLRCHPYKATWKDRSGEVARIQTFTIIPDAFLDFRVTMPDGRQRRMPVLIEHDRGTEQQHYFKRRIRAYIVMLQAEVSKAASATKAMTIAFTTFAGQHQLEQMREWTRAELAATNEPKQLGMTFCFANLQRPLNPRQVWLEPWWYMPYDDVRQPMPLLAEV